MAVEQLTQKPLSLHKAATRVSFDAGLRSHMLLIYRIMAIGLAITGVTAATIASVPALYEPLLTTSLKWIVMIAPLGFVLYMSLRVERWSFSTLRAAYIAFCATMGGSMASIFLTFSGTSIARAFFVAAGMFLLTSLWGYTTKRDLSRWRTFLMMALVGLILALVVNLLLGSSGLQLIVSIIGVIVFAGLTAFDTQRAKAEYLRLACTEHAGKLAVMSALSLYLNLVNLVQLMLLFTGSAEE